MPIGLFCLYCETFSLVLVLLGGGCGHDGRSNGGGCFYGGGGEDLCMAVAIALGVFYIKN